MGKNLEALSNEREWDAIEVLTDRELAEAKHRGLKPAQYLAIKQRTPERLMLYGPHGPHSGMHHMDFVRDTIRDMQKEAERLVEQAAKLARAGRDALAAVEMLRKRDRVRQAEASRPEPVQPKPKKGRRVAK